MGELLWIGVDATTRAVPNTYEGIKEALDGATLDYVRPHHGVGFYVDDEGLLSALPLNVVASLMAGMVLFGPVVMCSADPDDEGGTLPATDEVVHAAEALAGGWRMVLADAARKGQDLSVLPEPGHLPPPQIMRFLFGDPR